MQVGRLAPAVKVKMKNKKGKNGKSGLPFLLFPFLFLVLPFADDHRRQDFARGSFHSGRMLSCLPGKATHTHHSFSVEV